MNANDLIRRLSELPRVERELEVEDVVGVWIVQTGRGRRVNLREAKGTPW